MKIVKDRDGTDIVEGDFVIIIKGPNPKGDIASIPEMKEMAKTGKVYKVEELDIQSKKSYVYIDGWWFESQYISKFVEIDPKDISIKGVKPTMFDINSL